jgi:hypothetical protein
MDWTLYARATTPAELNSAFAEARTVFASQPAASILIETPGDHDWSDAPAVGDRNDCVISMDDVGVEGSHVTWRMNGTITFPVHLQNFRGLRMGGSWRIEGGHHTKARMMASQGTVVSVGLDHIVVQLDAGYPGVDEIFIGDDGNAQHLRRYQRKRRPRVIKPADPEATWDRRLNFNDIAPVPEVERGWRLSIPKLHRPTLTLYPPGTFVAVQSKHGKEAFLFDGPDNGQASEFVLSSMTFTCAARFVVRRCAHVEISDCWVRPKAMVDDAWPALATSAGGFQLHAVGDPPMDVLITRNRLEAVGDDPIALFGVASGEVSQNFVRDNAGMRGINIVNCGPISGLETNQMARASIVVHDTVSADQE